MATVVHMFDVSISTCNVSAFNCLVNYVVVSRGRMIILGSDDSLNIHASYWLQYVLYCMSVESCDVSVESCDRVWGVV